MRQITRANWDLFWNKRSSAVKTIVFLLLFIWIGTPVMAQRFPGGAHIGGGTSNAKIKQFKHVGVTEKLGNKVPLDIQVIDSHGHTTTLRKIFDESKTPVVLDLAYYTCPMLCPMIQKGLLASVKKLDWNPGVDYRVITVSFDPRDTPHISDSLQTTFLHALKGKAGKNAWRFYTAKEPQIKRLTKAVGFNYRWYPAKKQYIHTAVLTFLSPKGKVSAYLYGITFPSLQLKNALSEAAHGKIGTTLDKLVLYCCQFNPGTGKYTASVLHIMNIGAVLIMTFLGTFLTVFWVREKKKKKSKDETA
ncbi:MAG TPA: SCO family protein [Balneolales bacterium]|nr:SCO family protein [Balneolales bacterium]